MQNINIYNERLSINQFEEQQKLIEDLKFQQSQIAFKEQIALLEQIKAKQLELEKMQKSQYKQEKELLRRKGEIMRMRHESTTSRRGGGGSARNDGEGEGLEELSSSPTTAHDADQNLTTPPGRSAMSARRPLSAVPLTPGSDRKVDQFAKNMEERARMREQLKREREEKRKKQEQEKLELMKGKAFRKQKYLTEVEENPKNSV